MSFVGNAIGDITGAIGSVLGPVGSSILDVINPIAGLTSTTKAGGEAGLAALTAGFGGAAGGSMGGSILSGIESLVKGGVSDLSSIGSALTTDISSLFKGGFSSFISDAGSVLTDINKGVNDVASTVDSVIKPIATGVNDITATVNNINDKLIQPVTSLITTSETQVNGVLNAIHGDLSSGIQGFLKLPNDIANAFTSVDAQFSRATQELGASNAAIVKDQLVPGLGDAIGRPLDGMNTTLSGPVFTEQQNAVFNGLTLLGESATVEKAKEKLQDFETVVQAASGFFGPLIKFTWEALKWADFYVDSIDPIAAQILQQAKAGQPVELLSAGQVIDALRRDMLTPVDAEAELLKQGISKARQNVLYNLAQFMFGARDSVNLLARGIISQSEFEQLMNHNNLDPGQYQSLQELMQHILGPGDIAAALARGYVTSDVADKLYNAALVPDSLKPIIPELERSLVNPAKQIAMAGRQASANAGFLTDSLNSEIPPEIEAQYERTQSEDGTGQLDWLAHWDVPQARWWVTAFWRGLRTREEVYDAFRAHNIPTELWDDIFSTEEQLPPVWLIPDVVAAGVWSREQAIPQLMKLGFSEENATVLFDYGYSKSKAGKSTTAADLQKISLGNAKAMFEDGLVDQNGYEQILVDHGYSNEAAQLTVQLTAFQLAQTERKNQAALLLEEVKLGQMSKDQAESNLFNLGFSSGEVAKYLDKIEAAKILNRKLPSETQVKDAYKKGLVTGAQAVAQLELLGYDPDWSVIIFKTW